MRAAAVLLAVAAAAAAALPAARAAGGGGILDVSDSLAPDAERCFNLTFDEMTWSFTSTSDQTVQFFNGEVSSGDYYTQFGSTSYGGLTWSNLQVKSNQSATWSANAASSQPNTGVSWIATPIVALAERGAFRPVSVSAALQSFFPLAAPGAAPKPRPPSILTVWSVRAGAKGGGSGGGPEFVACATAALPHPTTDADNHVGKRVLVDLSDCGPASAGLVFGLTERFAFFNTVNEAFLTDSYFTIDDLAVCAAGTSVSPPPRSLYLPSPPLNYANRRRRRLAEARDERRRGRRVLLTGEVGGKPAAANGTGAGAANGTAGPPAGPQVPIPTGLGGMPVAGGYNAAAAAAAAASKNASSSAAWSMTTTPVAPAPPAGPPPPRPLPGAAAATAADRAAATAATIAAGGPGCFAQGFDALSWRPTVNHTLETDSYVSFYNPLVDGAGLNWVNAAITKDAAPPPGATSAPHYANPRFPGPVYAFAQAGAFRPLAVAVASRCESEYNDQPVDPGQCPGPAGPMPVFEVAALRAGGADGLSGAELRVCATAELGAPPAPPAAAGVPTGTGPPIILDLAACGPAVLALRFRLVPPFAAKELSFTIDDLVVCPGGKGGGGGKASVKAPAGVTELPVVDPAAWPGSLFT